MDCLEFRRRLAAEPRARADDFMAHRDSCHSGCTEAWWRAQRLERRIENAMAVDAPEQLAERVLLAHATRARAFARRWRIGLALAASLVLATGVCVFGWNRNAGADPLPAMPAEAVFVRDCDLGSYRTVHMVFRIGDEPVTAMYFIDHPIADAREFKRSGWQGREVPMGKGTLLLLGADARGFAQVERAMDDALEGPPQQALGEL